MQNRRLWGFIILLRFVFSGVPIDDEAEEEEKGV